MKITCVCIVALSIVLCLPLFANDDFKSVFAQFAAHKPVIPHKPKVEFSDIWEDDDCYPLARNHAKTSSVVYTASDMNKNGENPDTSFNTIYASKKISIHAWKMLESKKTQQEISLLCALPDDYDDSKPLTIVLYVLVHEQGSTGKIANINVSVDSKIQGKELGPDFLLHVSTGNFLVIEPSNKGVSVLTVEATIPPAMVKPKGLLVLVFNRIAPVGSAEEYERNLYLQSVVLNYEKK